MQHKLCRIIDTMCNKHFALCKFVVFSMNKNRVFTLLQFYFRNFSTISENSGKRNETALDLEKQNGFDIVCAIKMSIKRKNHKIINSTRIIWLLSKALGEIDLYFCCPKDSHKPKYMNFWKEGRSSERTLFVCLQHWMMYDIFRFSFLEHEKYWKSWNDRDITKQWINSLF